MSARDNALEVMRFETAGGADVFRLPLEAFPGFWVFAYLVLVDGYRALLDAGSGLGGAGRQLERGLQAASRMAGREIGLGDLTHVLITHGHIDHFGGLTYLRPRTQAVVGIHELDRRTLTNYEERLAVVTRRLDQYLIEAGVSAESRGNLLQMYRLAKSLFHSVQVDFTYEERGMRVGPFEMLHVPGHCAGHVVVRLHDVLFSGDHVLQGISPHQAPEHLTLSTGLDHYLKSLEALRGWASGVRLTLGGHNDPVTDLDARIAEIKALHHQRLEQVLEALAEPHSIAEVSRVLFGQVSGYHVLLALEEAGAHVEYLYQRGRLEIANLPDLESGLGPVPIRYRRARGL